MTSRQNRRKAKRAAAVAAFIDFRQLRLYRRMAVRHQGFRCFYCWCPLSQKQATGDHAIPRCHGGKTIVENIKAACHRCNHIKAGVHWQVFVDLIAAPPRDASAFAVALRDVALDRHVWSLTWAACERIAAQVGMEAAPPVLAAYGAPNNNGRQAHG